MNKAQWKALYDYRDDMGYSGAYEVLKALKYAQAIDKNDTLEDLGEYDKSGTYDGMMEFLTEALSF